jgi:hypothetical protein
MLPRVTAVKPKPGFELELTFTSGEVGFYDCHPLLTFGVFRELSDEAYFQQVGVFNGMVVWPHEQDICPDTLYLDSRREQAPTVREAPKAGQLRMAIAIVPRRIQQ